MCSRKKYRICIAVKGEINIYNNNFYFYAKRKTLEEKLKVNGKQTRTTIQDVDFQFSIFNLLLCLTYLIY